MRHVRVLLVVNYIMLAIIASACISFMSIAELQVIFGVVLVGTVAFTVFYTVSIWRDIRKYKDMAIKIVDR